MSRAARRFAAEQREPRERRTADPLPRPALALEQDPDAEVDGREEQEPHAHPREGVPRKPSTSCALKESGPGSSSRGTRSRRGARLLNTTSVESESDLRH